MSLVIKKLMIAVKKGVNADGMNLGMNNGEAAGQLVFHAHFHIIPRYLNDGHVHWKGTAHTPEENKETAEKIIKLI
jgi:histidine triad (HIT) family protein